MTRELKGGGEQSRYRYAAEPPCSVNNGFKGNQQTMIENPKMDRSIQKIQGKIGQKFSKLNNAN